MQADHGHRPGCRFFCLALAWAMIFLTAFAGASAAGQFEIIRVYDGDTVKAAGHDIEIMVRLVGIDSPETGKDKRAQGQPYSRQAKKYLTALVLHKTVEIKGFGLERYNRLLGVIYLDGTDINLAMVRAGLAEVYSGRPPHGFDPDPYLQAQTEARQALVGMWSLRDDYISPSQWRKLAQN